MQALRPFLSFVTIKIESIFVKNKKNLSKINKILPPPDRSVERGILCGKKTVPSSEKGGGTVFSYSAYTVIPVSAGVLFFDIPYNIWILRENHFRAERTGVRERFLHMESRSLFEPQERIAEAFAGGFFQFFAH